ncbi:unnamed protein product [Paramecium octaurelia]|uniref:Uncharacterized protein n=1 Tax=Paramecium octaurelia TaxID=43137 RepID=A0A8S1WM74_PAROT|nr:unnamed protein product [Paramecium octaurelia]
MHLKQPVQHGQQFTSPDLIKYQSGHVLQVGGLVLLVATMQSIQFPAVTQVVQKVGQFIQMSLYKAYPDTQVQSQGFLLAGLVHGGQDVSVQQFGHPVMHQKEQT